MPVAVVTDSTAYLPEGLAQRYHVRVVPLHVTVDDRARLEGVDLGPVELAEAMARRRPVSTSMATPAEFAATYRRVLAEGADGVVSVHLSGALSGTCESARAAAEQVSPDRVRVVDSRSTAMGLGFAVVAAAIAAGAGADPRRAAGVAADVAARTRTLFCLETLEWLRRGGRIGAAQALLGTALSIKPLLHVQDGRIVPLEKVRTSSRAEARLVDRAAAAAGDGPVTVAVHHLGAPERAERIASQLRGRLPGLRDCYVSEVGAVVGAHTGPGALGVVVLPGGL
ncbi:DegV family protein [Streptoalloteichus hindustanus]|uniref:EDD domain protein, DegV family n=1 Tax=Streptoalloteichus hindustanus TaxID=2017 RepID=A0A1M5BMM6_STRHI|nr:DegV family protein [Streptoalloteichus hindustanus]SHF43761.1 EDD domain protein, DegV family [Streptoalloteichus hindustanus]